MLIDFVAIVSAGLMLAFSFLVMRLYWPIGIGRWHRRKEGPSAEVYFAHGIVVGFASALVNAVVLKGSSRILIHFGVDPLIIIRIAGLIDFFVVMPLLVWACYCHLYSAWLKLPEEDKVHWSWITRPFYPTKSALTNLMDAVMNRLNKG